METVKTIEGHADYIRCLMVHPILPLIFSSSDDASIRIWNWEDNFNLMSILVEHVHYVMQIRVNPKDLNSFASASLDLTIKVNIITAALLNQAYLFLGLELNQVMIKSSTSVRANYSLIGHESGVNCVDYYKGDKPYIVSGADDSYIIRHCNNNAYIL